MFRLIAGQRNEIRLQVGILIQLEPLATSPAGGVQVKRDAGGIDHVIVNGTVLLENGELTGALPGQIIRGPLYQAAQA